MPTLSVDLVDFEEFLSQEGRDHTPTLSTDVHGFPLREGSHADILQGKS